MDYKNYNPRAAALAQARTLLTDAVKAAVADGTLPEAALPDFIVEIPADVKNGDIASNVAMAGARAFHKAPRQIAEAITAKLQLDGSLFDRFEVAGPGFINLFLGQDWFTSVVRAAVANPEYGRTDVGAGKKYNVEFVSANPTGPMHMGNARGGALGDGLAACLDWAGYDVTRERATRLRSSARAWPSATCSSTRVRTPARCPRSAIRARTSSPAPRSLPRSTATLTSTRTLTS